jgi:hypothetical protein
MNRTGHREMDDQETIAWLRAWASEPSHMPFDWPTDACGYEQHMRFVKWRNAQWHLFHGTFNEFVLDYARKLGRA